MTDSERLGPDEVRVTAAGTGVSVTLNGSDIAAFAWVDGVDVERWADDFAATVRRRTARHIDGDVCQSA